MTYYRLGSHTMAVIQSLHGWHVKLRIANGLARVLPEFFSARLRSRLYTWAGFDIAPSTFIIANLTLISGLPSFYDKLQIGPGGVIGNDVTINIDAKVLLGRNVSIGPNVMIYTASHGIGTGSNRRMNPVLAKPVTIEDGCWLGLASIVLPGVTVGHGSIVAAGTVVTENVPPNSYVEGNPARVIRQLPWGDR